jgi:hypothetical protein
LQRSIGKKHLKRNIQMQKPSAICSDQAIGFKDVLFTKVSKVTWKVVTRQERSKLQFRAAELRGRTEERGRATHIHTQTPTHTHTI